MAENPDELARILRAWRDRVSPADVGLPPGGDRRAAGLRREEVAALAGVSVDYLTRLEQGRATHPSAQVLSAFARALRLSPDERDHLYRSAGAAVPTVRDVPTHVTAGVMRLIDRLGDVPVAVYSASFDLLLWNQLWAALFGLPEDGPARSRNIAWREFVLGESAMVRNTEEQAEWEHVLAADLRSVVGRYPHDPQLAALIADLRASSPRFAELWSDGDVEVHRSMRKTVSNPLVGLLSLDCDVLTVVGSELSIIAYTVAPGSEDAAKLDLLRVRGLATFA